MPCGACEFAVNQHLGQRLLVDHAPAGRIDDKSAGFHLRQRVRVDEGSRLVGEGHVQRDDICTCQQLSQFGDERRRIALVHVRVVGEDFHAQTGDGAAGNTATDPAQADDAEDAIRQFHPTEMQTLQKPAGPQGFIRFHQAIRQTQDQCQGMLGDGISVGLGRPQYRDPTRRRHSDIDVVDADAVFGDDPQICCCANARRAMG
jgi:hypothetical protein